MSIMGMVVLTAWRKMDVDFGYFARLSNSYAGGMVVTGCGSTGTKNPARWPGWSGDATNLN